MATEPFVTFVNVYLGFLVFLVRGIESVGRVKFGGDISFHLRNIEHDVTMTAPVRFHLRQVLRSGYKTTSNYFYYPSKNTGKAKKTIQWDICL